jgi:hypothetical protein
MVCPHDPAAQQECESGKPKDHPVNNGLLVPAPLTLLWLRATHGGCVHEQRLAATTPVPAGSRL